MFETFAVATGHRGDLVATRGEATNRYVPVASVTASREPPARFMAVTDADERAALRVADDAFYRGPLLCAAAASRSRAPPAAPRQISTSCILPMALGKGRC
jgi:hypothetical protein